MPGQHVGADLEGSNLRETKAAVDGLWNLSHHRLLVLEGVRRIAFRNMSHLADAKRRCEVAHIHGSIDDRIDCIQKTMLDDQGFEVRDLTGRLIGWATFYPIQVYLALVHAEVDYYRQTHASSAILSDSAFSTYLDSSDEWVSLPGKFRDFFLHPSDDYAAELDLLGYGESYNTAPEFQEALDGYLNRARTRVLEYLKGILSSLPETQRAYCRSRFMAHYTLDLIERIQDAEIEPVSYSYWWLR